MKAQKLAVPATLFAVGAFAAPGQAATMVDYTASANGTAINITGPGSAEYTFYGDEANNVTPSLSGALVKSATTFNFNEIGPVSSTPYYPSANASNLAKDQSTSTTGYYGLRFSDGSADYTGYALVDKNGYHISEIDFKAAGVPEPATWAMMMLGLGGVGAAMRQRRRSAASAVTA